MDVMFLNLPDVPPPRPTAAYSHAVRAGDWLFVTGQLGVDPATARVRRHGGPVSAGHAQPRTVLRGAGTGLDRAVMARIYLTNFADYEAVMRSGPRRKVGVLFLFLVAGVTSPT
jgi:2-iminobutanoate/2-iminopropanoate deaminase